MPRRVLCSRRKRQIPPDELDPNGDTCVLPPAAKHQALRSKEIKWVEGLRGLAALGVLSNHLTLCYANYLFRPCCAPTTGEMSPENTSGTPHLFQLPILRLVAAGETFVALFLILTGFTTAYKPLGYARVGQFGKAYSSVAVSSFRRIPRLFFPATVASIFSWAVCNLGGYETARIGDAWWMIALTPTRSSGPWYQAFVDIWWAIWRPWMPYGVSPYDQPQWALQFFVEAGMMVFLAVLGTARLSSWWRVVILSAWAYWSAHLSVAIRDPWVGYCTLFGMILAELNLALSSTKIHTRLFSKIGGLFFIFVGLVAMSYPRELPEKASWSFALREMGEVVLPFNNEKYKPWVSLGCLIFIFGISFSSTVQSALSIAPMIWLGKISFPIYLLHGTFVRSLFAWILFIGEDLAPSTRDQNVLKYPLPSNIWIAFSVICLLAPLLICSHFWVKYLEPAFDNITLWLEGTIVDAKDREHNGDFEVRSGWFTRLGSTFLAIASNIQHGGLTAMYSMNLMTADPEPEANALLHEIEDHEMYPPTQLFPLDAISVHPSRYQDKEERELEGDKKEEPSDEKI